MGRLLAGPAPLTVWSPLPLTHHQVQWFLQQTVQRRVKRSLVVPTDPWFSKQWYMVSWLGRAAGPGHLRALLTLAPALHRTMRCSQT